MIDADGEQWLTALIDLDGVDGCRHVVPVRILYEPTFTLTDYVACAIAVAPGARAVTFV